MHLVRNTLRYVSKKYWQTITREMRDIYTAASSPAAEALFSEFAEQWRPIYPAMIASWETSWNEFIPDGWLALRVELAECDAAPHALDTEEHAELKRHRREDPSVIGGGSLLPARSRTSNRTHQ